MNTFIDKIEDLINKTPSGEERNTLTELNIIAHQQINLCDGCQFHIATCDEIDTVCGSGKGNDNVIQCDTYEYEE